MKIKQKILKMLSVLFILSLIMNAGFVCAQSTEDIFWGEEIYFPDFDDGVPEDAIVWSGQDGGYQVMTNPDLSVIDDPSGEGRGNVLKIAPTVVNEYQSVRLGADKIELSDTVPTYIEYDYYIPDGFFGDCISQFFRSGGSFNFSPVYLMSNDNTYYYGSWNNWWRSVNKVTGRYVHVTIKLIWKKGTSDVIVSVDHMGKYSYSCTLPLSDTSGNNLKGLAIGLRSKSASLQEFDYICIDNFKIYKEKNVEPDLYMTDAGVIAEDTMDEYSVGSSILENMGTGWANAWQGERIISTSSNGMSSGNKMEIWNRDVETVLSGPFVQRYFSKAIDLTVPGVYEFEEELMPNDGAGSGVSRGLVLGKNISVTLKNKDTVDGRQYLTLTADGKTVSDTLNVGVGANKIKMRLTVLNGNGDGKIEGKVWGVGASEQENFNISIDNINLLDIVDKGYINSIGLTSGAATHVKNIKISKCEERMSISSHTLTNADGSGSIEYISDIQNGLKVDASFVNTTSGTYVVLPVVDIYDSAGKIIESKKGEKSIIKPFLNSNQQTQTLIYDTIPQDAAEIKINFINYYTQKPFKNCEDFTLILN